VSRLLYFPGVWRESRSGKVPWSSIPLRAAAARTRGCCSKT